MKALEAAYQLSLQTDNAVVRISILCQLISITKDQKNNQLLSEYLAKLKETLHHHTSTNPMLKEAFYDVYLSAKYITPIIIYMQASRNKHIKIWLTRQISQWQHLLSLQGALLRCLCSILPGLQSV